MSGFEIAGLVLGAFPIVCGTAKEVGLTLAKAKDWWQFQRAFESFVSALSTQEIAYIQVLKRLLEPLDISDQEYNSLLKNPDLWNRSHIQDGLRQRLSDTEHYWVTERLSDLEQTILAIQDLLPDERIYSFDVKSLDSELYRLQTSFSSEKDRLLERITTINDELHRFLERATTVTRQPAPKPKVPFRELQGQAVDFYECLAKRWRSCCCPSAHTLGIAAQLAPRSVARSRGHLNVVFEHSTERRQVKVEFETVIKAPTVEITSPKFDPEAAGKISRYMNTKKKHQTPSPSAKGKTVAVLEAPALPVTHAPGVKQSSTSFFRQATKKFRMSWKTSDSKKTAGTALSMMTPAVATVSHLSVTSSSTLVTVQSAPSPAPQRSEPHRQLSTVSLPPRVRFASESSNTSTLCGPSVGAKEEKVTDMCKFATFKTTATAEPPASVLEHEDLRVLLQQEPQDQSQLRASKVQTMDNFVDTMPSRFNRLAIGLRFALTLLSLATSPWIPESLEKNSLFLISGADSKTRPLGPYVARTSRDIRLEGSSTWHARSSLLLLGVVLLELFFGEPLERQPCWVESLDNGEPNENTRFCSAFLWACRADDSLKECFGKDLGGNLSDAIRKCIQFDFERESDFGDARFAELVYREVVVPLEKCCPI